MTPFYHPTSILVLDDDPLFLESVDFQFSDELSCQTFTRPDAALEHLRRQASQHPDFSRYIALNGSSPMGRNRATATACCGFSFPSCAQ